MRAGGPALRSHVSPFLQGDAASDAFSSYFIFFYFFNPLLFVVALSPHTTVPGNFQ